MKRRGRTIQIFEPETPPDRPRRGSRATSEGLLPLGGAGHDGEGSWSWIACVYCRGQGYVTRPEWLLAWLHPKYPDVDQVDQGLRSILGGARLRDLPVREPCTWCSGGGRRYDIKKI